jgi:hypothetical protein
MLMLKPPCELGPLAIEIELFDSTKSSSFIFITSNEYGFVEVFYSLCSGVHPTGVLGLGGDAEVVSTLASLGCGEGVFFLPRLVGLRPLRRGYNPMSPSTAFRVKDC